ncbi:MAG: hypothetical protein SOT82_09140 [Oscillospiraceae bacterium]|nr:hypothetical protein [Oscillospiraceae bacterium]
MKLGKLHKKRRPAYMVSVELHKVNGEIQNGKENLSAGQVLPVGQKVSL